MKKLLMVILFFLFLYLSIYLRMVITEPGRIIIDLNTSKLFIPSLVKVTIQLMLSYIITNRN